ncbi:monooxygenase [Pseudomassariella vexata]|uniref:Monooxygenase n=1 Tax=Pseudomassariella vexata TaxID=1141098 RepID=A0A1Y2E456_9PEZI|nr:monooxygenase [Pseudomassariella vexata]ORY66076.1 monooxygenase [Pseudomassariella vexata]
MGSVDTTILQDNVIVDGVLRYPPTGIKVLVVGAGLGGLLTALECWRKGHTVQILEKGGCISEAGDFIGLGPNVYVTIREYPTMFQEWNKITYDPEIGVCFQDGSLATSKYSWEHELEGVAKHAAWPLRVKPVGFRRDIALMYLSQCERLGIPITYGVNIIKYSEDPERGIATAHADDGRLFTGDVVVAADGIGTKSHGITMGKPVRATDTGYCADRICYSTKHLKDAPALKEMLATLKRPQLRLFTGTKIHAVFLVTQDRVCVLITHKDDGTASESWAENVTPEQVASALPDQDKWDPKVIEAVRNTPSGGIVRWKLCWRNPQPKWTSDNGQVVQIGDAAHSLLPTSGNGAAMALEDATSLAECLRLGGKADVASATKVHELLRYQRTSLIQHMGFVNRREIHRDTSEVVKGGSRPLHFGKWIWTHNPERYAAEKFEAARAHIDKGAPFENTNLPAGHVFEDWTMEEELEKEKSGVFMQDLKTNGDWGLV